MRLFLTWGGFDVLDLPRVFALVASEPQHVVESARQLAERRTVPGLRRPAALHHRVTARKQPT